jgi:predicted unusual protein kinase regulating ubiquinone biosynthesis (AarF/ABC1/UbiB family)
VTRGAIAPSTTAAEPESEPPTRDASTAVATTATAALVRTAKIKLKLKSKQEKEAERKEKLEMDLDFCRMNKRYDPEVIQREAMARPVALVRRGATVLYKFWTLYSRRQALQAQDARDGGNGYATAFKTTLTSLGPLFVKLGQNLANRPDLVDEGLMEELTQLQDRVPPFPTYLAMQMIEEDAGRTVGEIYESISPEPVAAASIGQVYKATLRGGGETVAVKILRPGTRPQVVLDLFILRAAAERLFDDFARKNLGCPATLLVDEFAEKLLEELDFQQEALNLRDFKRNFSDDPSVQIPVHPKP